MSVALPPPISPGQVSPERARQGEAVTEFASHGFQVHVFGAKGLAAEKIAAAVNGADTISNGLRALASAHYATGYPAAQVTYAVAGHDLYVLVTLQGVSSVNADAPLGKYFEGMAGTTPLTAAALEPRRVLASMHADRAGMTGTPTLVPEAGDGVAGGTAFTLHTEHNGPSPTQASLELGNPGNRYIGRYFLDLDLLTGTKWGDEIHSLSRTTLRALNSGPSDGKFWEQNLGWNRVTTWGIFGLGGRYVDYSFNFDPVTPLNGNIWLGEVRWQYPVLADFDSRLTTQVKLDRTSKTTELAQTQVDIQHELYNSAEVSGAFQQAADFWGEHWDLETGLVVRKGLGSGKAPIIAPSQAPDLDYLLYRGALLLRCNFARGYALSLETSGQYSRDTVPEQQQLVLGGFSSLTSALPGVAAGDMGFLARLAGTSGRYAVLGLDLRPKIFVDYDRAHFNVIGGGSPMLADAGAQLDLSRGTWLEAALAYAERIADHDLSSATLDAADASLYFRVKIKY